MKRALFAPALAALALAGCIEPGFGTALKDTVEVSRTLAADGRFLLENTNGSVQVEAWDQPQVRVEAVKAAASERALREIEVLVEGEGGRVAVRSRMPRGRWWGRAGKIDYLVHVPRTASVEVRNVNGRVEVRGVLGPVKAQNVNGSLDATDVGGAVDASTVNGSVEVQVARVEASGRSRLRSTNGSVRVTLPRDVAADVTASTVNGSVRCDFDLDGRATRRRLDGRIGGGGARFDLETVNGSATIDRGLSTAAASARPPAAEHPSSR